MFGSEMLEVAIGLSFIFFFASLVCSAMREALESYTKTRARDLEEWLRQNLTNHEKTDGTRGSEGILGDGGKLAGVTLAGFYEHSLIYPLFNGDYREAAKDKGSALPSYLPASHVAGALLDLLAPANGKSRPALTDIASAAEKLENERLKNVVLRAVGEADGDLEKARASIENWFDQSMERLSGIYKRRTQFILVILGLLTAAICNIDAIAISQKLVRDKATRSAVVAEAVRVQGQNMQDTKETLTEITKKIEATGLGIGYGKGADVPPLGLLWLVKLGGWIITAAAIMLGAPFWFDILNKLVSLRASLKPTEKKEDKTVEPQPLVVQAVAPAHP